VPLYREFALLPDGPVRLPDESTILRFRHLLEKHGLAARMFAAVNATLTAQGLLLKTGSVVDATLIHAPSSTKSSSGTRDPEMVSGASAQPRTTKKGNNWYFGMTSPHGPGQRAALVREADAGLGPHKAHIAVDADSGYRGIARWSRRKRIKWSIAMTPGHRRALDLNDAIDALTDGI
jgi:transposase, IS5 family